MAVSPPVVSNSEPKGAHDMFKHALSAVAAVTLNLGIAVSTAGFSSFAEAPMPQQSYGYETVKGLEIFFREAGDRSNPAIVLLHGFQAHPISTEILSTI